MAPRPKGPPRAPGLSPFRKNAHGEWIIPEGDQYHHHCRHGYTDAFGVHHLCPNTMWYSSRDTLREHIVYGGHHERVERRDQRANNPAISRARAQPLPAARNSVMNNIAQPTQQPNINGGMLGSMIGGQLPRPIHHDQGHYGIMGAPPPQFANYPPDMANPYGNPYAASRPHRLAQNPEAGLYPPVVAAQTARGNEYYDDDYDDNRDERRGPANLGLLARAPVLHHPFSIAPVNPPNFAPPTMPSMGMPPMGVHGPPDFGQHQQQPYRGMMEDNYQSDAYDYGRGQRQEMSFHHGNGYGDPQAHWARQHLPYPLLNAPPQHPYHHGPPPSYRPQASETMDQDWRYEALFQPQPPPQPPLRYPTPEWRARERGEGDRDEVQTAVKTEKDADDVILVVGREDWAKLQKCFKAPKSLK